MPLSGGWGAWLLGARSRSRSFRDVVSRTLGVILSLHFDWTLSLRLRPDVPAACLTELRFQLGLGDARPSTHRLPYDFPSLVGSDLLPGGSVRSLSQDHRGSWGVFLRTCLLDDGFYGLVDTVPIWLAPQSQTQGWIGWAREELDLHPALHFFTQDGHAYAAGPGEAIQPLAESAPPFTLTQTFDTTPWP